MSNGMPVSASAKQGGTTVSGSFGGVNGRNFEKLVLNSSLRGDARNTKLILAWDISALSLYVEDAL